MIYELRQYLIDRGRMEDNHDRMANHTPALLARHGVRVIGRWEAVAGPRMPNFCYIMEWRDFAEREACWAAFYADPEWPRIRAATNAGSELVQASNLMFLRPNPVFRQDEGPADARLGGLHQLITQKIAIGLSAEVNAFLETTWLPTARAAGARIMGVCDMVSGPELPAMVMLLAWPDEAAWRSGWKALCGHPALRAAYATQRTRFGQTLLGSSEVLLLEPASYNLPFASLRSSPR